MSKLTEIMKLFCYDPETDGANTFNIPKALNENWEKIDQLVLLAIAVAAAYDPEGSYAVGDYCTHGGKLHKCSTPIPDGEAWNAEHWTETTVAAELAEVRASLSNKLPAPMEISPDTALNNVTSPGLYFCGAGLTVSNEPPNPMSETAFSLFVERTYALGIRQKLSWYFTGQSYYRTFDGESWHDWVSNATATPPQEYDLPLAEGITAMQPCTYSKNQFGEVTLGGCAANAISDSITIATLPVGFRPARTVERPATLSGGGQRYAGSLMISTDGAVKIRTPVTTNAVVFAASFIAANLPAE